MPVSRLFYNFANAYVTMVWNTEDFYCFSGGLFIALMCKEQHMMLLFLHFFRLAISLQRCCAETGHRNRHDYE